MSASSLAIERLSKTLATLSSPTAIQNIPPQSTSNPAIKMDITIGGENTGDTPNTGVTAFANQLMKFRVACFRYIIFLFADGIIRDFIVK